MHCKFNQVFSPSLQERWKFWTLTFLYGAVFLWHQSSRPSLAVISSTEMSWMANLKMMVQIIPRVIFTLPSTISREERFVKFLGQFLSFSPSAPMETNLTPLLAMKSRALLTLAILWNLKSCKFYISGL